MEVQDDGVFPDVSPTKVEAYLNRGLAKAKADTGNKALPQGVTLTEDVREKDGVNYIKGSDGKYYKQSIYGE